MRVLLAAAVAALMFSSVEANAGTYWKCVGPQYVCGSPKSAVKAKKSYKSYGYAKKNYKKNKSAKSYYKTKKSTTAYSKKNYKTYSSKGTLHGKASYYWQPQKVASGGWFNPNAMTAAHKTLPFGTRVRVTNKHNGKSVVVRINDRGPYIKGRIIDLSKAAAGVISMRGAGVVPVSVTILGKS